jgi:GT2 family glycosyltransferase
MRWNGLRSRSLVRLCCWQPSDQIAVSLIIRLLPLPCPCVIRGATDEGMKITIGIPVYNCERWIGETIRSALDQTWPEKEVLVIDDGSTDNTVSICRSFGSKIRFVSQGKLGGNAARNHVLRLAGSDWIQFVDADDYLGPEKIAKQLAAGVTSDADVICSPVIFEKWEKDRVVSRDPQIFDTPIDWYSNWIRWNMPQTGGCLWRRESLLRIGGWNESFTCNQEYELYFRAFQSGLRFKWVDAPEAVYRLWSEDTVCRKDKRAVIKGKTQLIRQFLEWLHSTGNFRPEYKRLAGVACFEMARTLATQNLQQAKEYYAARRREGLMSVDGPAAPWKYRLTLTCFGFSAAEQVARAVRH